LDEPKLLMIDNLLDTLPDETLRATADYLFDSARPWTLVVATGRKELIERCNQTWRLSSTRSVDRAGGHPNAS
jgi:predicted ABC-type transport system involved in lysophospholipase L1 biosynthesis ATPase subunit